MIFLKKNILPIFLSLLLISCNDTIKKQSDQNITDGSKNLVVFDANGEISILEDFESKSFTNWYVLQTNTSFKPKKVIVSGELHFHPNYLKIEGPESYLFYINDSDKENFGEKITNSYQGFGLAKHASKFKFLSAKYKEDPKRSAKDLLVNLLVDKDKTVNELELLQRSNGCTSGGQGASGCSIGEDVVVASPACSVTCIDGYYACCQSSNVTCKCKKQADR